MCKAFKGILTVILLAVSLQPVFPVPQTHDDATAPVAVVIERYMSVRIVNDTLQMTVKSDMVKDTIKRPQPICANSRVIVCANCPTKLVAPTSVTVKGPGEYQTIASILFEGDSNPEYDATGENWVLPLKQGIYNGDGTLGNILLNVYYCKDWGLDDHAGVYTGTIELQLFPL